MTNVLRAVSIGIAAAALIDPSVRVQRVLPLPVRVQIDERDPEAVAVRERVRRSLDGTIELREYGTPAAVVVIEDRPITGPSSLHVPVSTVSLDPDNHVEVVDVPTTISLPAGSAVDIPVELFGRGMRGATTVVAVEERGIELGRVDHIWTNDGPARLTVPYMAVSSGLHHVTIRAREASGGVRLLNNVADVGVQVTDRPARVAVIEARPSWHAGFVRRALENDPHVRVSSVVRVSEGISARSGDVSRELRRRQLDMFDVVLIGAPEDLTSGELEVLNEFARVRGATVILLPDTRVAGPYAALLPGPASEQLLREPRKLAPAGMLASEIVGITNNPSIDEVLAAFDGKAVVVSWAVGDGRFVFSGALDAWRYRADPNSTFTRFWRQTVSEAALAAPPRLNASVNPAVVRPAEPSRLTVRLRRTEFSEPGRDRAGAATAFPAVAASVVDPSGDHQMIRLWPSAEPGVFEGEVNAAAIGLHNIRVTADTGATADGVLVVDRDTAARRGPRLDDLPALTGGVAVRASNLEPLTRHLSSLPRPSRKTVIHPMRSPWWMAPFASCLCLEWLVRRRRGER